MAHARAIGVVSRALANLITERYPRADFGTLPVELYQSKDFETPMRYGVSVFLWRVTPNTTQRLLPPRRHIDGTRVRPPLPLDLHYCLSPWAETAETQQRLLGWMMRMLDDLGPLPAGTLNHFVAEDDTFRDPEGVDMVLDPLATADYLNFWERLKAPPVSAHYVARFVLLESERDVEVFPRVAERQFDMAEAE